MRNILYTLIQRLFSVFGLHVRRLESGVNYQSAFSEQIRLVGDDVLTIVEVGAANGRDCLTYLSTFPDAILHAFEPHPDSFKTLAEKARQNSRLVAVNKAVSSESGKMPFYLTSLTDASSLYAPQSTGSAFDKYTKSSKCVDVDVAKEVDPSS